MADRRLDDCLSTRGGHLYVEGCDTLDLLREFGSPLFVLSEDQIRRNARRFREAFQAGWPQQVAPSGTSTVRPAFCKTRAAAIPACGAATCTFESAIPRPASG